MPSPRLFHDLRASRERELVGKYPIPVVTSWFGNTPDIAMQHDLLTTPEHFKAAVRGGTESDARATQNPAQRSGYRRESQETKQTLSTQRLLLDVAGCCDFSRPPEMAEAGFEPARA